MTKNIVIGVLVATTLLFAYLYISAPKQPLGAATGPQHYSLEAFLQGLQIGGRGSEVKNLLKGTCNITQAVSGSFAASTSQQFLCAVTGVQANDLVLADLPIGAGVGSNSAFGSTPGPFIEIAAYATTTNVIGVTLYNATGAATSSFPQATTSVDYWIVR